MKREELNAAVKELRELKRMQEEIEAEIETLQDQIKDHMTELATDEITGTDYKITYKEVISNRLDSKTLKAELPDIASRYTKQIATKRFLLK